MLRQDINLYTAFKTSTPALQYLSWRQLIISSIGFILLLIVSYIFSISDLYYQTYYLKNLNSDITRLQSQFENKKALYPSFFFSDNVEKEVENQEKSMRMEAQLLEKIANRISFSNILLSLAEIDVANIWVNEITIQKGGNSIELTGNSLSMPDLKSYFTQIKNNHFFKNDHVTINKVEHAAKDNYPDFQTFILSIAKIHNEKTN